MYKIYKYDWGTKNRIGAPEELVYSSSSKLVCAFDTYMGVDLRMLSEHTDVAEYESPDVQSTATVYEATIPFYAFNLLKRRVRDLAVQSSVKRFVAAFYGHSVRPNERIRDIVSEFSWTPSRTEVILM